MANVGNGELGKCCLVMRKDLEKLRRALKGRYGESLGWTVVLKMLPQLQSYHSEITHGCNLP